MLRTTASKEGLPLFISTELINRVFELVCHDKNDKSDFPLTHIFPHRDRIYDFALIPE